MRKFIPTYFLISLSSCFLLSQENTYGMQISRYLSNTSHKLRSLHRQNRCSYHQQIKTEKTKKFVSQQSSIPLAQIIENPLDTYREFNHRLKADGPLAGFPEFQETVDYLLREMHVPAVMDLVKDDQALLCMHNVTKLKLLHLNLIFDNKFDDYPHMPPFSHPYPYFPSICAIKDALEFFDTIERITKNYIPPIYHTDRYLYYFYPLLFTQEKQGFILIPTRNNLSISDFIKVRTSPIGFLGVSAHSIFADGYYNSPLDFFIHDINHTRRMKSFNNLYAAKHKSNCDIYSIFDQFTKTVLLPSMELNNFQTKKEQNIRKMLAVLYFELGHEYAHPPERNTFIQAFKHRPGDRSPFEHMVKLGFDPKDIETLRMPNHNLASGFLREKEINGQTIVRYFFDRGPNFLTSAYNKLKNSFYDNKFERNLEDLPDLEERNSQLAANAAQRLWTIVAPSEPVPDLSSLLEVIQSAESLEKYPHDILERPIIKLQSFDK